MRSHEIPPGPQILPRDPVRHPCFELDARHAFARLHLPVAPRCNVQCNFCDRRYDCANESRPGVTSAVLSPYQALAHLERFLALEPRTAVVGIAGPGDPFANPEETLTTLSLVQERYPGLLLCVASNGLAMGPHLDSLATLGVTHATVTVNAVDPRISARIYAWVRDGTRVLRGERAGEVLLDRQLDAVRGLKQRGILVKINCIVVAGVNDHYVPEVARVMEGLGADLFNCVPLLPAAGTPFGSLPEPGAEELHRLRAAAGEFLPQMTHCRRCRADAAGLLDEPREAELADELRTLAAGPLRPDLERPNVAIASLEGALVNQHLGEAERFLVFGPSGDPGGDNYHLIEERTAPPPGGGNERWRELAGVLGDCRAVLVSAAGETPRQVLHQTGIEVCEVEGLVAEVLRAYYAGEGLDHLRRRRQAHCGAGECMGDHTGCCG